MTYVILHMDGICHWLLITIDRHFTIQTPAMSFDRRRYQYGLEAAAGIEPAIKVLQTFALPLGYAALNCGFTDHCIERLTCAESVPRAVASVVPAEG
jgi:hypothetical protein